MIKVDALTRSYGSHRGVENISFQLDSGQVVGLLGPNGAGKSTTIKVLTTHLYPSAGSVSIFGFDVYKEAFEIRRILGYLPEQAPLYREMIVRDFLKMVGRLKDLQGTSLRKALDRVVAQCRLEEVYTRPIDELSRGFRQRVGLAQALLNNPRFLVLDEPTTGLDPNQVIEMRSLILEIGKTSTVLLSSHILSEVEILCQRVLIIDQGKLVADEDAATLRQTSRVRLEFRSSKTKIRQSLKAYGELVFFETRSEDTTGVEISGAGLNFREKLVRHLIREDLYPLVIGEGEHELETVFSRLTGGRR
jgi:ABC-2 type transport system ATP-binding protein